MIAAKRVTAPRWRQRTRRELSLLRAGSGATRTNPVRQRDIGELKTAVREVESHLFTNSRRIRWIGEGQEQGEGHSVPGKRRYRAGEADDRQLPV